MALYSVVAPIIVFGVKSIVALLVTKKSNDVQQNLRQIVRLLGQTTNSPFVFPYMSYRSSGEMLKYQ